MSETAPNVLPAEQHKQLETEIEDVAQVAREADSLHRGDHFHDKHNGWVDGPNEASTRMLGQGLESHRIQHRGTRFGGIHDSRIDVRIRDGSFRDDNRRVHSYTDRRYGSTSTEMKVRRNDHEKAPLKSDNPFVHKLLAEIALKTIRQKAVEDIHSAHRKAA